MMKLYETYSTWVEVDLNSISGNVASISQKTGVPVMAVVKADAYGHGIIPVARSVLENGGASWLGVARIEEALQLRDSGLECPILVLGYSPAEKFSEAIAEDISLTFWNLEQLAIMEKIAEKVGKQVKVHLKVDSGMSRLGIQPEDVLGLVEKIIDFPEVLFEGVFTHFARADESDRSSTTGQELIFKEVLNSLVAAGACPPIVHAANSAAALSQPTAYFNLVRPGIAIYGLEPSRDWSLPSSFKAALTWKAVISQVKMLPPGRGVSYGHEYVTKKNEHIGTIPVGYADGFRRIEGNQVLVRGTRVPVVGRVCMDQISVQLDGVPNAKAGDEVVILGKQGQETITAEEIADRWGTINYEVVCGISGRVPRIYK